MEAAKAPGLQDQWSLDEVKGGQVSLPTPPLKSQLCPDSVHCSGNVPPRRQLTAVPVLSTSLDFFLSSRGCWPHFQHSNQSLMLKTWQLYSLTRLKES